ncbi:VWA domain-containing protein [Lentzea sp. NPDC003310]|uniref:vWA domain-containing protein n=1 Tax=Lentzea sp. NPDC003310 TaxID=3154447 RepID=UPI0033B8D866
MTRLVTTAVAALFVALSSSPAAAQADEPSRVEILAALGSGVVPADYVVLLDTSGSMAQGNRYATAVAALGGLFEALSAEDRVALYTFDSAPNPEYQGPSRPAAEILGKLPATPDLGGATDLGKALAVALQELQRDGAAKVANVVVVTDGAHDPAPGSPYTGDAAWEGLRQQAKQKAESTLLSVYAVPLGDGSSGAATVKSVFDGTIVLAPGDVQNLREYLNRSKARVEVEKARTVLSGDIGRTLESTWKVTPTDNGAQVVVTLTSTTKHVPLDVSDIRLSAGAMRVTVQGGHHRIDPGKSVDVVGAIELEPKNDLFVRRTVAEQATVNLSATVRSSWTAALKPEIDLAVDRELTIRSAPVVLQRTAGSLLFLPLLGILLLVLGALGWFVRGRRRDVLDGTLIVSRGVEPVELGRFVLNGHRTVLGGLPGEGTVTSNRLPWEERGGMRITYTKSPGTRPSVVGRCRSGGSLILGGLYFSHIRNGD